MTSVHIFETDDPRGLGQHGIQWQFSHFTIDCLVIDLSFARRILDFVCETRENPIYRNVHLGEGVFRHIPEMTVDLTCCFSGIQFQIWKIGEWDHGYSFRISTGPEFSISFELHEQELDEFLVEMRDLEDRRTRRST